jgi:hypothetical protein
VGTVFTFVAAADLDAAAPDLVAGITPAFNGFSATGFLVTLLASEIAGFFELGIRPRYDKNEQAEITGALPFGQRHHSPCAGTDIKQLGKRNEFLSRQDVGRTFGVQSLRLLTLSAGIYRWSALR